jgi:glycine/D-amino acid oxidase-like deaminating enzyme
MTSPTNGQATERLKPTQTIETDVLVVGGGTSGVGAAIAAARTGSRTMLVERYGFLGGVANVGLCLHTFHSSKGERIVAGIPWEMITRMIELGGSTGPVFIENAHMETTTPIDVEVMKYVTQELVMESGARILYHTTPLDVTVEDGKVTGVVVSNKGGRTLIRSKVVIDASGDGDIATWAGVPYEKGRKSDGKMQRMSMVFKVGNVDLPTAIRAMGKGGAWAPLPLTGERYPVWWSATLQNFADAVAEEGLFLGTDEFWGNTVRARETNINASRMQGLDGTNADDLSRGEIEGKRQVFALWRFLRKHVPGFQDSFVAATAPFVGVRETRRMLGEYQLTAEDCVTGRKFPDGIAKVGYPIDIHDPSSGKTLFTKIGGEDGSYDIPYRCLVPVDVDGLLLAGRCISTTHEAMASTRTMITGMMVGQAAGTAASLAVRSGSRPRDVDPAELRAELRRQGAHLDVGPVPGSEAERARTLAAQAG